MTDGEGALSSLARRSPTLFLAGGVVGLLFSANFVVQALTGTTTPDTIFAGIAFTLAFLGLLGLYPDLAERTPWLARVGAVLAVFGAVGFAVAFVTGTAEFAGVGTPEWLSALVVLNILGIVPGFLVSGIASLRTDVHPRAVGFLLLAPAIIFSTNFVRVMARGGPGSEAILPEVSAVLALGQALSLLGIGYLLRAERAPAERETTPADSTA